MRETTVAAKYAEALFVEAQEKKQLLSCRQGLEQARSLIDQNVALLTAFQHPLVPLERKQSMLRSALGEYATPLLESFLSMLIERGRLSLLREISSAFLDRTNAVEKIESLRVRSAVPLSAEQQQSLKKGLEQWLGSSVQMDIQTDPSLIGGIFVQSRDYVIDYSLKGQLLQLQQKLTV